MAELIRENFIGSTMAAGAEIERRVLAGWRIDKDLPMAWFGFASVEVGFTRDADLPPPPPPPTPRSEILAKARAAKALKKHAV